MALGAKAAGLYLVPSAWTPAFITVTPDQLMDPASDLGAFASAAFDAIPAGPLIVRSSAVSETLADRGRFDSQILDTRDAGAVTEALRWLRDQGLSAGVSMGAVIQSYRKPSTKGHLSNEYRVSKTRNHWQVEVEYPAYSDYRVNSQRDLLPPGNQALRLPGASLDRALARLGNWAARTFSSRVHMEWVLDAEGLWVVQLDREDDAPDAGVDPSSVLGEKGSVRPTGHPVASRFPRSGCLSTWSQDASPRYRKLRYTPFFRSVTRDRYPNLFVLEGRDAITFLGSSSPAQELQEIIGDRLVCRTDLNPERSDRFNGFNMPRTDTLTPTQMIEWIRRKYDEFTAGEFEPEDFVFIIHAFIPAVSGAWAIADPNQSIVFVDTLWGLPDGLQYLEHDRFEWDVRLNTLVAEHITYKDKFLHENIDGTWTVVPVARPLARRASASRREIGAIATATQELAVKVGEPLQVMWFIGTQAQGDIASSIPWFCHQAKTFSMSDSGGFELSAPTSKRVGRPGQKRLPLLEIRSPGDLDRIPVAPHRLRLSPDAEYMRDNQFLEKFAELAATGGHAIEMMGSGLAHAYYIMAKSGAPIIVPSQRSYTRARKLRSFGKLVRDGIPGKITGGGEEVRTVRVRKEDRRALLLSKVIEEVGEVSEATNLDDVRDEIADLFEVVRSLADNEGVAWGDVEKAARQKAERLGSFQSGTVLLNTAASGLSRRSRATDLTLARIVREGSTVVIPHLALIGDSVEVAIGGKDVRISFSTEGIVLEELGPESDDGQLRLPF